MVTEPARQPDAFTVGIEWWGIGAQVKRPTLGKQAKRDRCADCLEVRRRNE